MKCSNCGAEISNESKKCPYCDCEVIQEPVTQPQTTINNNFYGHVPKNEETRSTCPRCGSKKIQFKREEIGSANAKRSKQVLYRTVGICQDCGNTWNAGNESEKKKHGFWFWVLAILFWPISLCIWFYKTERIKLNKKFRIIIIAAFWLLIIILGAITPDSEQSAGTENIYTSHVVESITEKQENTEEKTDSNKISNTTTTQKKKEATTVASTTATTKSSVSIGKQNALSSAKGYLRFSSFSYKGLKEQLEFEGYSADEATYGADNCGADWNEQAAKKAQSYLDFSSFSRDGLIEQLEFEGFTHEQAVYGVSAVGY